MAYTEYTVLSAYLNGAPLHLSSPEVAEKWSKDGYTVTAETR